MRGKTLDDEPDYAGAAAALERAKGALRTKVGAGTGVRFTPTLSFVVDKVPDTAQKMEELLAKRALPTPMSPGFGPGPLLRETRSRTVW